MESEGVESPDNDEMKQDPDKRDWAKSQWDRKIINRCIGREESLRKGYHVHVWVALLRAIQ